MRNIVGKERQGAAISDCLLGDFFQLAVGSPRVEFVATIGDEGFHPRESAAGLESIRYFVPKGAFTSIVNHKSDSSWDASWRFLGPTSWYPTHSALFMLLNPLLSRDGSKLFFVGGTSDH
jgi:hypothetical protein